MSSDGESAKSAKRKRPKWWVIVLLVFGGFTLLAAIINSAPTTTTTPTPEVSAEPVAKAEFTGEITRWEPINPASGRAVFTIRNISEIAGAPGSCYIRVQDESNTYKGSDYVLLENEIAPGAKFMGNVILTVTKEGAYFVEQGRVNCS
jgi:hypothetical protein